MHQSHKNKLEHKTCEYITFHFIRGSTEWMIGLRFANGVYSSENMKTLYGVNVKSSQGNLLASCAKYNKN